MLSDQRHQIGHVRGRFSTLMLLAAVLCLAAAHEAAAQSGLPVYQDRTRARAEAYPGDVGARRGLQTVVVNPPDSLRYLAPGNDVDGAFVKLTNPPQGWIYRYFNVLQSRRSPGEVPDSSAVYPAAGATKWFAFPRTTLDGDSAAAVLFGIQVRGHPINNNDSLTTYVWMPTCSRDTDDAAFGRPDTIGTLRSMNFGLWDVDDCMPNERPWVVVHHGYPRGQAIALTASSCAEEFASDFISFRLRPLRVYKADGTVHTVPVQTVYSWDVYGYR